MALFPRMDGGWGKRGGGGGGACFKPATTGERQKLEMKRGGGGDKSVRGKSKLAILQVSEDRCHGVTLIPS